MITEYHFCADIAELLWELQWPAPGVRTTIKRSGSSAREVAVMTVKEGYDAECDIVDWRRSLNDVQAFCTPMPNWLLYHR